MPDEMRILNPATGQVRYLITDSGEEIEAHAFVNDGSGRCIVCERSKEDTIHVSR